MQRGGAGWAGAVARVRHRGGRNGNAAGSQRGATPGAESPRQHRHSGPHKHKRKPGHAHAPSNADIARARRCYVASAATATRPRTAAHVSKSRRPPRTLVRTMACAPETADRYAAVPHAALVAPSRCTHAVVAGKRARGLRLAAAHGGDGLNDTLACLSRGRLFNLMELISSFWPPNTFFFRRLLLPPPVVAWLRCGCCVGVVPESLGLEAGAWARELVRLCQLAAALVCVAVSVSRGWLCVPSIDVRMHPRGTLGRALGSAGLPRRTAIRACVPQEAFCVARAIARVCLCPARCSVVPACLLPAVVRRAFVRAPHMTLPATRAPRLLRICCARVCSCRCTLLPPARGAPCRARHAGVCVGRRHDAPCHRRRSPPGPSTGPRCHGCVGGQAPLGAPCAVRHGHAAHLPAPVRTAGCVSHSGGVSRSTVVASPARLLC